VLRRLAVDLRVRDAAGATKRVRLDLRLAAVGEPQRIAAPRRARPLSDLLSRLGAASADPLP
jgi:hypothetical protein